MLFRSVSLTLMFSTFTPVIANAIFVFIVFILSSNLRIINAVSVASSSLLVDTIAAGLRFLLPVSEVSGLVSRLLQDETFRATATSTEPAVFTPRGWSFIYEMVYIAVIVFLAAAIFRKRDLR